VRHDIRLATPLLAFSSGRPPGDAIESSPERTILGHLFQPLRPAAHMDPPSPRSGTPNSAPPTRKSCFQAAACL